MRFKPPAFTKLGCGPDGLDMENQLRPNGMRIQSNIKQPLGMFSLFPSVTCWWLAPVSIFVALNHLDEII